MPASSSIPLDVPRSHRPLPRLLRPDILVPLAVGLCLAIPLVVVRYPASTDMPQYEMQLAGLLGLGDARFPTTLYETRWGAPNQLLYPLALPFAWALGPDAGIRIFTALLVALSPFAVARAARALGRTVWVVPVAAPLFVGGLFRWGLLANILCCVLVVAILPELDAVGRRPGPATAGRAALGTWMASLAHLSAVPIVGLVLAAQCVGRDRRGHPWRLLPLVPAVLSSLLQAARVAARSSEVIHGRSDIEHPVWLRLAKIGNLLVGPTEGGGHALLAALALVAIVLLWRGADRGGPPGDAPVDVRWLLTGVAVLAQYVIWPYGLVGAGVLYGRFLLPGAVIVLLAVAPCRAWRLRRAGPLAAGCVPVAMVLMAAPDLAETDRGFTALDRIVPVVREGSALVQVNLAEHGGAIALFTQAFGHVVAVRGGRARTYAEIPYCPFQVRPEMLWEDIGLRLSSSWRVVPEVDLRRFDYVLVHVGEPQHLGAMAAALGDTARLVAVEFPWGLFESLIRDIPIDAPDAPLPPGSPPNLGVRLGR